MKPNEPAWVGAILKAPVTALMARIVLTSAFWVGGMGKLVDFNGAVAEQAHFGLNPPVVFAVATIAVELLGSVMIILNWRLWLGAGALGVFTFLAAVISAPFWTLQGQEQFMAMNTFLEHMGLIAGLVIAAIWSHLSAKVTS
jgi:uncharacterized membrane protein YphA (DoxX/SURF4 family)